MPFGMTTTTKWYAPSQWTSNGNLDYDIAIMSLASPIGNQAGHLDWGWHDNDSFFMNPANVFYSFGYPAYDGLNNPVFEEGERLYYMKGYMDSVNQVHTACNQNQAFQGQSGSGLYHQDAMNQRKVYGVLSHGSIFPPYVSCHAILDSATYGLFNTIINGPSASKHTSKTTPIFIYPNPSQGLFTLDFGDISGREIGLKVFDAYGKRILDHTIRDSQFQINLSTFPSGTYFVQAGIDGYLTTGRIYKEE